MVRTFFIFLAVLLSFQSVAQKLKWETTTVDFGKVEDWNSPVAEFRFINNGKQELFFLPQHYQRDVSVEQPIHPVKPGQSSSIKIRFYTNETGTFKRKVNIYHGASQKPEVLTVIGNIRSLYADALTACPRFGSQTTEKRVHRNVVVAIDRETGDPIKNVRLILEKNGHERSDTHTGPHGRSSTKIETGRYTIFAEKQGYQNTNADMVFKEGHTVHWIYMDPISKGKERADEISEQQDNLLLKDFGLGINDQWDEPELTVEVDRSIAADRPKPVDANVSPETDPYEDRYAYSEQRIKDLESRIEELEYMTDEADLGLAEDRFAEDQSSRKVVDTEPEPTMEEMGVGLNDQWEEAEPDPIKEANPLFVETEVERMLEKVDTTQEPETVVEVDEPESKIELVAEVRPEPEFSERSYRRNNLVLLLDVSSSMNKDDKMIKLKATITRLVAMLRKVDVLSIITYNTQSYHILPATPVANNQQIIHMIDTLTASGFTNGVKGMNSAYDALKEQWIEGGNNQMILATDGKFNSSKFSEKEAVQMVKANSAEGRGLSIIGFGEDKDATRMMKKMAKYGNGSFLLINKGEDPTELLSDEIKLRSRIE